jgi:EpsD family peptidyl-prolyl cis-trans isomerase
MAHQVNFLLANPSAPSASQTTDPLTEARVALEQFIEEDALVKAAVPQRLNCNSKVLAAMEVVRSGVLVHAYLEQVRAAATRPSAADIHAYFEHNPALFFQRWICTLREIRMFADSSVDYSAGPGKETQLRSLL